MGVRIYATMLDFIETYARPRESYAVLTKAVSFGSGVAEVGTKVQILRAEPNSRADRLFAKAVKAAKGMLFADDVRRGTMTVPDNCFDYRVQVVDTKVDDCPVIFICRFKELQFEERKGS